MDTNGHLMLKDFLPLKRKYLEGHWLLLPEMTNDKLESCTLSISEPPSQALVSI